MVRSENEGQGWLSNQRAISPRRRIGAALLLAAAAPLARARAQLPPGFVEEIVIAHPSINFSTQILPTSIAFSPDGSKLFFTLKIGLSGTGGDVWAVDVASLPLPFPLGNPGNPGTPGPFASLPSLSTSSGDNQGMLGVAVDPNYATNGFVYAFHDPVSGGGTAGEIVRFTDIGGVGTNPAVVAAGIPQSLKHNGGKILFGPDGFLYLSIGDVEQPAQVPNPALAAGKIHRFDPAPGAPPPPNPWGGTAWAYGLRNVFGMAFSPVSSGVLFANDPMGPCRDELDRVTAGCWYGWLQEVPNCSLGDPNFPNSAFPSPCSGGPNFVPPACLFEPSTSPVTPTGLDFCYGGPWPAEYAGDLFTLEYATGRIRRLELTGLPGGSAPDEAVVDCPMTTASVFKPSGQSGIELKFAPGGDLYFATTNGIRRIRYTGPVPNLAISLQGIPGLGRTVAVHAVHGNPGWSGVIIPGAATLPAPVPTPWGSIGIAFLTPLVAFTFPGGAFDGKGVRTLLFTVPNLPALVGGTVYWQGFEIAPGSVQGNSSAVLATVVVP